MKKIILILFFILVTSKTYGSIKESLINNLKETNNLSFNFEQNIAGNIQNGNCIIEYPKKIFCKYNSNDKKILVSNGNSVVIKSSKSYYIYPLKKTPLNFILDKNFLLEKILNSNERIIDEQFINFSFIENDNKINIFFDKETFNLIGWQTTDIYQNLTMTYINSIIKNKKLKRDIFILPRE